MAYIFTNPTIGKSLTYTEASGPFSVKGGDGYYPSSTHFIVLKETPVEFDLFTFHQDFIDSGLSLKDYYFMKRPDNGVLIGFRFTKSGDTITVGHGNTAIPTGQFSPIYTYLLTDLPYTLPIYNITYNTSDGGRYVTTRKRVTNGTEIGQGQDGELVGWPAANVDLFTMGVNSGFPDNLPSDEFFNHISGYQSGVPDLCMDIGEYSHSDIATYTNVDDTDPEHDTPSEPPADPFDPSVPSPYNPGGDDTSDTIDLPDDPLIGITNCGFINVYNPTQNALVNLGTIIFPSFSAPTDVLDCL